jgi:hypothetical protein
VKKYTVLLFLLACTTVGAETIFEVGPTQVSSNWNTGWMITITERFKDRYDLTAGYITEQDISFCSTDPWCDWTLREQLFFGAELLFKDPWDKGIKLGIGPYLFQNPDRIAMSRFRWSLHVEWRVSERWGLSARHFSTGGTSPYGCQYRRHDDPSWGEVCNDWNTGQDSWLRFVWYMR